MPWIGTGVTFGLEFIHYLGQALFGGASVVIKYAIARLSPLLMHFATTYVQKKIIEKGEEKGEDARFKAWVVGVGIHSLYNLTAVLLRNNLDSFIKGNTPSLNF